MEKFHCDGMVIKDEQGRERVFRGFNRVVKEPRYLEGCMRDAKNELPMMLENGCNLIRLGITWEILEPEEGKYDTKAVALVKDFVRECAKNNVYVMLDMHQDLYSPYFYGDGAPAWAVDKSIVPEKYAAIWAEGYFYMDSVQQGFTDFWHDKGGVQTKFIKAWKYFASQFEECENVIGLDYLNEPYVERDGRKIFMELLSNMCAGVGAKRPNLTKYFNGTRSDKQAMVRAIMKIVSGTGIRLTKLLKTMDSAENFGKTALPLKEYTAPFNKDYYQPFFEKISAEAGVAGKFNMFEHNYFSNLGVEFSIDTKEGSVYSPHAYDIFVDSPLYDKFSSNGRLEFILGQIRKNQEKMNVPVIFGEWGGSSTGENWIKHIDFVMNEFEKYHWSNLYWGFDLGNAKLKAAFNRPYPVAVNGKILQYKTDTTSRRFSLSWEAPSDFDKGVKTQVFIPEKGVCEFENKAGINEIDIVY